MEQEGFRRTIAVVCRASIKGSPDGRWGSGPNTLLRPLHGRPGCCVRESENILGRKPMRRGLHFCASTSGAKRAKTQAAGVGIQTVILTVKCRPRVAASSAIAAPTQIERACGYRGS